MILMIGEVVAVDGSTRTVWKEGDGRQFLVDDDGEKLYGQWLAPADEPIIAMGLAT
jgi:hypothetical protein